MLVVFKRLGLLVVLLMSGAVSLLAQLFPVEGTFSNQPITSSCLVTLAWNPSPDTNVIGYYLCWGRSSDGCTNQLDVGNAITVTLGGLETNMTYYFRVFASSDRGEESAPSNEIAYSPPHSTAVVVAPKLDFELQSSPGRADAVLRLSFEASAGINYHLEATTDFQHWEVLWTTNFSANTFTTYEVSDVVNYPRRFFRLLRE